MNRRPLAHASGRRGLLRPLLLCAGIAAALGCMASAHAADASGAAVDAAASAMDANFDRSLLSGAGNNTTDLSRFEHGNPVQPGVYNVDVFVNQAWIARRDVRFAGNDVAGAKPCLDGELFDKLGVRVANQADIRAQLAAPNVCMDIGSLIKDATMTFDQGALRLDVSVPQAYMSQAARGYVSPEYWDPGVTAALVNYNFNSYHSTSNGTSQTMSYLGLNAGLNLGLWQFRQDSTVTWQAASSGSPARTHWDNVRTYVQRALPNWHAVLTVGDSYTDGQVFDTYGIRGVQLSTDDRMLPDSLRGYAPVVHGVAETNALVTIRQNGVQIYQTTVAPGPFAINDLYPTGYGGNLDVTVTEADGRVRAFTVPYASIAQLLRPGTTRFSIAAGQMRDTAIDHKPNVVQATIQRGINNMLTGYAGIVASQGYAAALAGAAINTRYGAVGVDITQSHAEIPGEASHSGQSLRISYSKIMAETHTSLTVAAYRYSTSGYLSLNDAVLARDYVRRGMDAFSYVAPVAQTIDGVPASSLLTPAQLAALSGNQLAVASSTDATLQRQRNRFDLTLSQALGAGRGAFFVSGSANDYWNRTGTDTQFQMGYNNTFHRMSYGFTATRTRDAFGRYANGYFLNVSVPLGSSAHSPTLMFNMSHDATGNTQEQAMVNGSLGADNQFNYGATASHSNDGGDAGSVNVGYRSPYALANASFGSGRGYSQASLGVSGAVVAHPGGITFGQPMGDTVGIISVPGAGGARLSNASGARVNQAGYALVPYLNPYSLNTIQIDPKGLPLDVQLDSTSAQVAPYAGSVVMLKFKTENGRTAIIRAHLQSGDALPFGAEVFNEKGVSMGMVGQGGQIVARGVGAKGSLTAHWQDDSGSEHACSFPYELGARSKANAKAFQEISVTCAATTQTTTSTAGQAP